MLRDRSSAFFLLWWPIVRVTTRMFWDTIGKHRDFLKMNRNALT